MDDAREMRDDGRRMREVGDFVDNHNNLDNSRGYTLNSVIPVTAGWIQDYQILKMIEKFIIVFNILSSCSGKFYWSGDGQDCWALD